MADMERTYVECDCHSEEHVLRFTLDPDDGDLYLSVYLDHMNPWYKRIWVGIKYVFGYTSQYGHFDCVMISGEQTTKLQSVINNAVTAQQPPAKPVPPKGRVVRESQAPKKP